MMSSVIPARLVFECGHAALVSLPRIKGETSAQRADRVAREKSAAQMRACDFCAQRLEVVVQHTEPAPPPAPVAPVALPPVRAIAVPPAEPVHAVVAPPAEHAAPPAAALPLADSHADRVARAKPRPVVKSRPNAKSPARNGRAITGARFSVQFRVQTVLHAADMRDALRQAQSLGAIEVLAITRET